MSYLDEWARNNLSPENQEKFFVEQKRIQEESEQSERWFFHPEEAIGFSDDQIQFLRDHNIAVSTAYIGMVRFYHKNRTIFQTSAMAGILNALPLNQDFKVDFDVLSIQAKEYLDFAMSISLEDLEKLLNVNLPLFGIDELDCFKKVILGLSNYELLVKSERG